MKKKGFTLIELLAVIVVLAIIALIATPIVMNVIKKANEGAAERSADNYIKAVETLIATEKLDGTPVADGKYQIEANGDLSFGKVEVSGTKPIGGIITIKDGQVVKKDSTIDYTDHIVTFDNGKAEATEKEAKKLLTLADCDYVSGTKAEGEVGAKYTCNFGDKDRTFYILETGADPITNSTLKLNEVALILEGNYDMETLAWCASGGDNACKADNLEDKLDDIVEEAWTKLERSQIGIPSMEQIMVADEKVEEAYLDYPSLTNEWLYSYPDYAELNGADNPISGYWTSTPNADYSEHAWMVLLHGDVAYTSVDDEFNFGVRPVITLSI